MSQPGRRLPWLVAGSSVVVAVAAVVTLIIVLNSGDSSATSTSGRTSGGSSTSGSTTSTGSGGSAQADTSTPAGVAQAAANALNDNDSGRLVALACPAGKDWVTAKITRIDDVAGRNSFQANVKPGDLLVVGDYYAEVKIELTYAGMPTNPPDEDDDEDDDDSDDIGLKMGKADGEWCIAWLDD
jgi:hypothetical protein